MLPGIMWLNNPIYRPAPRSTTALSREVKRSGRSAKHSPRSSTDGKNKWSHTSIPSYAFMTYIGTILLLQEWRCRPNRALTSTVRYLHGSLSLALVLQLRAILPLLCSYDCSITPHKVFRSMTRIRVTVGLCSQKTNVNIKPQRKTLKK